MTQRATLPAQGSKYSKATRKRYVDGYRVANTIDGYGMAIKVIGAILGVLVLLVLGQSGNNDALALGLVAGAVIAGLFFLAGVVIAAQGQMLMADLDKAVYASPFLTDEMRASVMSLRLKEEPEALDPQQLARRANEGPEGIDPSENGQTFCYHCGGEVADGATRCPACGKEL